MSSGEAGEGIDDNAHLLAHVDGAGKALNRRDKLGFRGRTGGWVLGRWGGGVP